MSTGESRVVVGGVQTEALISSTYVLMTYGEVKSNSWGKKTPTLWDFATSCDDGSFRVWRLQAGLKRVVGAIGLEPRT